MTGECVGIVSGKGGTGKTVFTAAVGAALARAGRRVLCIDCDAGLRNLDLAMGLSETAFMDLADVIYKRCTLREALVEHPRQPGLFLLNAPARSDPIFDMAELLEEVRREFDFCLLDAPPGRALSQSGADPLDPIVRAADRIAVLTLADPPSVRYAQRIAMDLERFPDGAIHVAVNRVRRLLFSRMRVTIDDIMDQTGLPLLGLIPEDDAVPLALAEGLPVPLAAPKSAAAKAFRNIAARIAGQRAELARMPW